MNLSLKKLYLALFMVVAVGFQSFADTDLENARTALTEAETAYAEKEAALAAAKASLMEAKTELANAEAVFAEAEASFANAKTTLDAAKAAVATAEASSDAVASTNTPAPAGTKPVPAGTGEIPDNIRHNEYFLESERLLALAQGSYNAGDYDAATEYAEEAARFARLSDEYIAQQTGWEGVLPATYTVREWDVFGDCFWNIAALPWVYNDPHRWRVLYEANRAKLPNPNNPNLVEPGTVLDIPSIKGETRQGEWNSNRTYEPLR